MAELEEMTLNQISIYGNNEQVQEYYQTLENLKTNRISRQIVDNLCGESIIEIMKHVETSEEDVRSYSFFPGDLVILYPSIKEFHSKTYQTCDFSGSLIYPNSLYINYRPLLENITKNEVYVLKRTMKVELGYMDKLPQTVSQLESLEINMNIEQEASEINFSHLNKQYDGSFTLKKLRR